MYNSTKSITKLCAISTKNPTYILLKTIAKCKKYYPDFTIIIIDSDSDKFETFKFVPPDIKIEYIKNKNWELGAWFYAFNKYYSFDIYMFIQDSVTPIKFINLDYDGIINSNKFIHFIIILDYKMGDIYII